MPSKIRFFALCLLCTLSTVAATAGPVLLGLQLTDSRLVNMSGDYSFSNGQVNCALTIVQRDDGTFGLGAYITGAGISKTFITSGRLKATGNGGLSWSAKGFSGDGFSLNFKGTLQGSGNFAVAGELKGPALQVGFSGSIVPSNSSHTLQITPTTVNDQDVFQFQAPFLSQIGDAAVSGKSKRSKIDVKESFLKASFTGSITKSHGVFTWTSGPGTSVVRFGKFHLVVDPSQFSVTLGNSNN